MFADLASIHPRIAPKTLGLHSFRFGSKSAITLSKIHPSRTRQSPTSNNRRLQRIGLPGQRRTPTPLMEPVPPFRGMRKLTDWHPESTENSRRFDILIVAVCVRTAIPSNMRGLTKRQRYSRF